MLYLVSTPIGNLDDVSFRVVNVLKKVNLILAEDTRRTGLLLKKYMINNKMMCYNDMNKEKVCGKIIEFLKQGADIALVTDNGTPGISDPGFYVVREAVKEHISVTHVPGISAFLSALICSGLPTDRFSFFGFLPKKEGKKEKMFSEIVGTGIFYESPHRIVKTMDTLSKIYPDVNVVIAREISKKFEDFIRGRARDVYLDIKDKGLKGEIVLLVNTTIK
ncbi:MAG: 16S rRNA (cytidine(1402)-2'-O)-methyltransferase [Nanoarchaeota archaeon]|nr:16S rRNA (cytidine(1402)-2'-O)-methyltransferase [Nanoarchaeota archaeon]